MSLIGFQASKIWMFFGKFTVFSKFTIYFQAEIKPQSLLFLDFVIVFHIILKNQKNWEPLGL